MKIIIIGGVAGGASAATRLRRLNEQNEIIVFERSQHVSFANCGLPYFIGGVIKDRDKLLLQTPQSLKDRFNLDVRVKTEVLSIDAVNKTVKVKNLLSQKVYIEKYDKLLLSPGAEPFRPNIKGINSDRIMTLRNIADMDKIISNTKIAKKVAVVGGGYIGLEIAENLIELGIDVTLVERNAQIMAPVDFEMATIIQNHAIEKGIELRLNTTVQAFNADDKSVELKLSNDQSFVVDAVVLAVGVKPENRLAKTAGVSIGKTGGILVNEYLQTTNKDIYAVGDAIEVSNYIDQRKVLIPLAWPANRQGRIVADNIINNTTDHVKLVKFKTINQATETSKLITDGCGGVMLKSSEDNQSVDKDTLRSIPCTTEIICDGCGGVLAKEPLSIDILYKKNSESKTKKETTLCDGCTGMLAEYNTEAAVVYNTSYKYKGTLGTSILKIFDLSISTTGLNERALKEGGYDYRVATVNRNNHAAYYPGASPIILKLLFGNDGTIYGAQAVGKHGVDKRIDVIATAIKGGLKVKDLPALELAYAPPFNSAKDPVNIVGYVAENMLKGDLKTVNYDELRIYQTKSNVALIDVRTREEFIEGAIPNAINIDINTIRENMVNLDKSKTYILYCQVGLRSYLAYNILKRNGFKVLNLNGGFTIWNHVFGQLKDPKILAAMTA